MAHGTGRLNVCCNQYTYVYRFSSDATCPICGKKAKQITKSDLDKQYWTSLLNFIYPSEGHWIKVEKRN
jgi:hypothetical protein